MFISLNGILSCPNQCGSVSLGGSATCGLGVLVANHAAGTDCFSAALKLSPRGEILPTSTQSSSTTATVIPIPTGPALVPSVGTFQNPKCYFDSPSSRVLSDGSSVNHGADGMTVEK